MGFLPAGLRLLWVIKNFFRTWSIKTSLAFSAPLYQGA